MSKRNRPVLMNRAKNAWLSMMGVEGKKNYLNRDGKSIKVEDHFQGKIVSISVTNGREYASVDQGGKVKKIRLKKGDQFSMYGHYNA